MLSVGDSLIADVLLGEWNVLNQHSRFGAEENPEHCLKHNTEHHEVTRKRRRSHNVIVTALEIPSEDQSVQWAS